jgi:hypothetical protein
MYAPIRYISADEILSVNILRRRILPIVRFSRNIHYLSNENNLYINKFSNLKQ